MVGFFVQLSFVAVGSVAVLIWWMRRRKLTQGISEEISPEIKKKYRLDEIDFLKSLHPEGISEDGRGFLLLLVAGGCLFFFVSMLVLKQVGGFLLPGVNPKLAERLLLSFFVVTVSLAGFLLSLLPRLRSYELRMGMGVDPLISVNQHRRTRILMVLCCFILISWFVSNDAFQDQRDLLMFGCFLLPFVGFLFRRTDIEVTELGILSNGGESRWESIAWYRWYDYDEGVLLGYRDPNAIPPFIILPTTPENANAIAALLEQYLPEKRFDDIETDWTPHEPAASATSDHEMVVD